MDEKKQIFSVVFRFDHGNDWRFTLVTTEKKTDEEIKNLIDYYIELNSRNVEDFTPEDVMNDLLTDHISWECCFNRDDVEIDWTTF